MTKRLNKDDADVVEVLHTDGGTFGFKDACGTIDFFANGGSSQPGCKQIDLADPLRSLDDPGKCDKVKNLVAKSITQLPLLCLFQKSCNSQCFSISR